jgi:hypothetical protein
LAILSATFANKLLIGINVWIIVSIAVVAVVGLIYFKQGGIVAQIDTVSLAEIPRVYEALQSTGEDGSWAGLIPPKSDSDDDEYLNVQFSIESGAIGFDWLLVSSINVHSMIRVNCGVSLRPCTSNPII